MREILSDKKFDIFYDILLFIGAASVITPGVFLLLRPQTAALNVLIPVAVAFFLALGWCMQSLFSAITHHERSGEGSYSYETAENPFRSSRAIVPIVINVVIALVVRFAVDSYLRWSFEMGYIEKYDEFSMIPWISAILVFLVALAGVVLWFYPVERIATIKTFFPCVAVITIEYVLSLYGGSSIQAVCAASLAVFIFVAIVLLNQTYIIRTFHGSVVSVVTPKARLFNILLVALLIVATLGVMGALYLLLFGLFTLVKMVLFLFIYNAKLDAEYGDGTRYYEEVELEHDFSKVVYGQSDARSAQGLFMVFAVFAVLLLFFLIFGRTSFVRSIIEKFKKWLDDLMEFFSTAGYFFRRASDGRDNLFISYKDEELLTQKAQIRAYNETKSVAKTYRDFQTRLTHLSSFDEKIGYAYTTLITLYRKMNVNISSSDTPREIAVKVNSSIDSSGTIDSITYAFELVRYAETEPDRANAENALNAVCEIIKRYMY